MEVDPDQTLADIRDAVQAYEDDVPELKDVDLWENKAEVVDQVNEALGQYLDRITSLEEQPELHAAGEEVFVTGGTESETDETEIDSSAEADASDEDTVDENTTEDTASEEVATEPSDPRPGDPLRRNVP